MTDKTPEGRKSDTMPLNMRERIIALLRNLEIHESCIEDENLAGCDAFKEIKKALLQAEKEGFERGVRADFEAGREYGIRECAGIVDNGEEGGRYFSEQILSLLNPREKSRIEREGRGK